MNNEIWSDWKNHDGKGTPIPGHAEGEAKFSDGKVERFRAAANLEACWRHQVDSDDNIIAYRYKLSADSDETRNNPTPEEDDAFRHVEQMSSKSDGSSADYYKLPEGCTQLQDLISHRNLNAQDGEIFRAIYRKGLASHSDALRDAKKVLFYAKAEVERLEKLRN